mmetsp:Transcript_21922/g.39990  ORF Transcript_21922/g.39990 Transcript_21922/m.39990 type:complete len:291 (-) Transcript_21922:956-1828(-)
MAKLLGFSDLTKKQEDLLTKGFAFSKLGVLAVSYQRGPDHYAARVSQTSLNAAGTEVGVVASGKAEIKHQSGLVSATVKSDGKLNYSVDFTPDQAPELKLKADLEVTKAGEAQEVSPTLNVGYNIENARVKFAYNPKTIKANFTAGKPEFGLGLEGKFETQTQKLSEYTFALWSSNAQRHVVFKHTGTSGIAFSLHNLSLSYFSELSKVAQFGASLNFDNKTSEGNIEFGGSYKQSDDVILRAKANSAGLVGLAFTKTFNQHLDFTLGTQLNLNETSKYQFGFKVGLKNE